jgi:anti-anti-sigma regulatory factor
MLPMSGPQQVTSEQARPLVFPMPPVLDAGNAAPIGRELEAALVPGVTALVADLTRTAACDPAGARMLARAQRRAILVDAELRLAGPPAAVLEVLGLSGVDRMLPIHPSLEEALDVQPLPELFGG